MSAERGMLHSEHPWIGRAVDDTATGRRGILRALAPDFGQTRPVAWLRPEGGGTEWTTEPKSLANPAPATPDTSPAQEQ